MLARPVIGVCTALSARSWSVWDQQAALLPMNYLQGIRRAGGMALMLAPDPALTDEPDEALDLLDGLLLAGGADIDPASYGAERTRRRSAPCRSATRSRSPSRAARSSGGSRCSGSAAACSC